MNDITIKILSKMHSLWSVIWEFFTTYYFIYLYFAEYCRGIYLQNFVISSWAGFKPGSTSECLLEFDKPSKPLGHHGQIQI